MNIVKKTFSKNNNEIVLIQQSSAEFEKTILIIGVVHGDEPQGKFLIDNYLENPSPQPSPARGEGVKQIKNRLLFIPCLNPDGLELNARQNANGVDLNRNFPTQNWQGGKHIEPSEYFGGNEAASEVETKFVIEIIDEFKPDVILTLHAPYKVVNYDGPAKDIAEKISEIIGYPATTDIGYLTPGSFGTYAGLERNIPTITLELDEEIGVNELINPVNKIFDYLLQM